jgi:deoxyinosine 3'endonuclease (endonuclease V)
MKHTQLVIGGLDVRFEKTKKRSSAVVIDWSNTLTDAQLSTKSNRIRNYLKDEGFSDVEVK